MILIFYNKKWAPNVVSAKEVTAPMTASLNVNWGHWRRYNPPKAEQEGEFHPKNITSVKSGNLTGYQEVKYVAMTAPKYSSITNDKLNSMLHFQLEIFMAGPQILLHH